MQGWRPPGKSIGMTTQLSFDEVVEKYTDFVYNVTRRMLDDPQDAEDATQEAFLSAYRNWDRFRGAAQVTTWLYRIAVNAALMKLRKEKPRRTHTQTIPEDRDISGLAQNTEEQSGSDWGQNPEKAALGSELQQAIEEGLQLLPPELRTPVVLRDIQELDNAEAAEVLELSVSAFKARLHRRRILLRKQLARYLSS